MRSRFFLFFLFTISISLSAFSKDLSIVENPDETAKYGCFIVEKQNIEKIERKEDTLITSQVFIKIIIDSCKKLPSKISEQKALEVYTSENIILSSSSSVKRFGNIWNPRKRTSYLASFSVFVPDSGWAINENREEKTLLDKETLIFLFLISFLLFLAGLFAKIDTSFSETVFSLIVGMVFGFLLINNDMLKLDGLVTTLIIVIIIGIIAVSTTCSIFTGVIVASIIGGVIFCFIVSLTFTLTQGALTSLFLIIFFSLGWLTAWTRKKHYKTKISIKPKTLT